MEDPMEKSHRGLGGGSWGCGVGGGFGVGGWRSPWENPIGTGGGLAVSGGALGLWGRGPVESPIRIGLWGREGVWGQGIPWRS